MAGRLLRQLKREKKRGSTVSVTSDMIHVCTREDHEEGRLCQYVRGPLSIEVIRADGTRLVNFGERLEVING